MRAYIPHSIKKWKARYHLLFRKTKLCLHPRESRPLGQTSCFKFFSQWSSPSPFTLFTVLYNMPEITFTHTFSWFEVIQPIFLQIWAAELVIILTRLFQTSHDEGIFPGNRKIARVQTVPKNVRILKLQTQNIPYGHQQRRNGINRQLKNH